MQKKAGLEGKLFRLVTVYKEDENKVIHLITNQIDWQAITIADLYKKTLGYRDIFQINESKPTNQNLCGNNRKCCKIAGLCFPDRLPVVGIDL